MFAALIIRPQSSKFLKRKYQNIFPQKTEVLQTAVRSGAPFFTVAVSRKKGEIPWDDIAFYAGNCAHRMLLPDGVIPPSGNKIKAFTPKKLPVRVLFNTACELLLRGRKSPSGRTITLIDENALLVSEVYRLLPFATNIRVVTDKTEEYEAAADMIIKKFGAAILVTDDIEKIADSDFIIAPDGVPDSFLPRKLCIVLSGKETPSRGFVSVTGKGMNLQGCYSRLVPPGINSDLFACALFENCGVGALAGLTYTRLHLYGADTTIYGAAKMLDSVNPT